MKEKVLSKKKFPKFVEELLKISKVIAPIKKNGFYVFQEVKAADEISLNFLNTKIPPKEIFYPRTETLFTYTKKNDGIEIVENENSVENQIILGIRSCDAKSFILLDKFFAFGKFQDPYYKKRRKKTIIIGLACIEPSNTCFCTSLGGSPFGEEGIDIILTDLGENYLVKSLNNKGDQLLEKISVLESASDTDISIAEELKKKAIASIRTKFPLEKMNTKLDQLFDEEAFWEQFSNKCIGCASCTFLCPTCSCFDVTDEETANSGKRVRLWDTCQFPLFTKHGSGHNPRPNRRQRLRQRVMHKFSYYPKVLNEIGCVGCGRCIIVCPVNQDIRVVFKTLQEA
ncbi:MAG: 4Fe-4S dicluster domain-containing protein [Promethearchaeota archaeon]